MYCAHALVLWAAIRGVDGAVHVGCNVENVAYPEGTCAEAGAIAAIAAKMGLAALDPGLGWFDAGG